MCWLNHGASRDLSVTDRGGRWRERRQHRLVDTQDHLRRMGNLGFHGESRRQKQWTWHPKLRYMKGRHRREIMFLEYLCSLYLSPNLYSYLYLSITFILSHNSPRRFRKWRFFLFLPSFLPVSLPFSPSLPFLPLSFPFALFLFYCIFFACFLSWLLHYGIIFLMCFMLQIQFLLKVT